MAMLVQVCVVILTLAAVFIALTAWRFMKHFDLLIYELRSGVREFNQSMEEARRTSVEVRELVERLKDVALDVKGVSAKFERVGSRASELTTMLLEGVERPIRNASALARGLRTGTDLLLRRWTHKDRVRSFDGGNDNGHDI